MEGPPGPSSPSWLLQSSAMTSWTFWALAPEDITWSMCQSATLQLQGRALQEGWEVGQH